MLESASMTPLIMNKLPGIFSIGWKHTTILSTGHYSQQFKSFLEKHFAHSLNANYCFNDIPELKRK